MGTSSAGPVSVTTAKPPALSIRDFLDSIDPAALEEAALGHAGGLCGPSTGECFLLALTAMAEEWEGA